MQFPVDYISFKHHQQDLIKQAEKERLLHAVMMTRHENEKHLTPKQETPITKEKFPQ